MSNLFIIVADRGRLRMFTVEKMAAHVRLRSIADTLMVEPRLKASEKYSDQAGARDNSGDGLNYKGSDEQLNVGLEEDKRLFKYIGSNINALLQEHGVERWLFSAPSETNAAILENVDAKLKRGLEENIKLDLVNVPTDELAQHFRINLGPDPQAVNR